MDYEKYQHEYANMPMTILNMVIDKKQDVLEISLKIGDEVRFFYLSATKKGLLIPSIEIPSEPFDIVNTGNLCRIQRFVYTVNAFCDGKPVDFPIVLDDPINWKEFEDLSE